MTHFSNTPSLSLYFGKVMHARMKPVEHRFAYSMVSMLIDLDRLGEADRHAWLFSVNRPNLVSFHEKHHGPRDGSDLRDHVDRLVRNAGLERPEKVTLLCYPSVFGYTFNPISVYFCEDAHAELTALIYQVHNTFGQSHTYVEPVRSGQWDGKVVRQERSKELYVSPFMEMDKRYKFRIQPPQDKVALRILEIDAQGPVLSATFHGTRRSASATHFASAVLQTMGLTWKVTFGIHFEALRLWLKGLKLVPRPAPPKPESYPEEADTRPAFEPAE